MGKKLDVTENNRGAVLILFALLLVALFSFIALTIDTTLITSSQSHLKTSADAAALGALEAYGDQLGSGATPSAALISAIARASASLGQNFNNNPGKFLQKQASNTQDAIGTDCTVGAAGNGCLRPIIWYPALPIGPNCLATTPAFPDPLWRPCPCDQSCECGDGCLNDPMTAVPQVAGNGLKLIYRTDQNSPLKALFGAVIGLVNGGPSQEVGLTTKSTALLAPRNAVFLLDLSESMVSLARAGGGFPASFYDQTPASLPPFIPTNATCYRTRYAFPIPTANSCNATDIEPPAPAVLNNFTFPRASWNNCGIVPAQYSCLSGATSIATQFDGGAVRQDNFQINTVVPPEPLTSSLDAVNQAMNSFITRQVPNDRLGIIGFDDERINNRILAINKSNILTIQPAPLSDVGFNEFEKATRVVGAGAIPITDVRRYSKYLFPRYYSRTGVPDDVASDLIEAFSLARKMIKHTPNYLQAQNFVVMFSDGMSNCLDPTDPLINASNPRCKSDLSHFNLSLQNPNPLVNSLTAELTGYANDKIAAHFLLLGGKSKPHRIAWRNSSGTACATADEIEGMKIGAINLPVVNAQGAFNANGSALVNQIYPWVKATGGLWAPILDSYGVNQAGACPSINLATFNAVCAALPPTFNSDKLTALQGSLASISRGMAIGGTAVWGANPPYWDAYGRILCDPKNRSTAQQVKEVMEIILGKPPFVLVMPN